LGAAAAIVRRHVRPAANGLPVESRMRERHTAQARPKVLRPFLSSSLYRINRRKRVRTEDRPITAQRRRRTR
jgi:hypothetical protein